jgi:hypothetical protein
MQRSSKADIGQVGTSQDPFCTIVTTVGGLYLTTHSTVATIIGTVAATLITGWALWLDRGERIREQALTLLVACARRPGAGQAPSADVDKGWHAFILHTADYAEFCDRVAGRLIHHLPAEPGEENDGGAALAATVATMRAVGLHVDADLWYPAPDCTSDCHQCHADCHDSQKRA